MRAPVRTRVVVTSALSLALAASGVLVGIGLAGGSGGKTPDLYPALPSNHSNVNSRWIDTFQASGKVLYRFDTVIMNRSGAGALDVFRTGAGADMTQVLWTSGSPAGAVTKSTPLPTASTSGANLVTIPGKTITYSPLTGHNHFHAPLVARYSLLRTDGSLVADAAKNSAGFCLYDSWSAGGPAHYASGDLCRPNESGYTGAVRMGISPGYGDFYASQLGDQWIDVTAATPGQYRLRAEVDPARIYNEDPSERGNNALTAAVTIPGAVADEPAPVSVSHGQTATINLTGTVVGADVKSRKNGSCATEAADCMTTAVQGDLRYSLVTGPGTAGTATVAQGGRVTFTPAAGFAGTATFTVRATDSRGLGGPPVNVRVNVAGAPAVSVNVSPTSASVDTGAAATFSATVTNGTGPVTWSVDGVNGGNQTVGTISSAGVYTAPAHVPAGGVVTVRALHPASGAAAAAQVSVTQAPPDPEVIVAISPGAVTLTPSATQQFAATVSDTSRSVEWSVDGVPGGNAEVGTVTSDGLYAAPGAPRDGAVTVRATEPGSGAAGEAFVTVSAPVDPGPQDPDPEPVAPTPPGDDGAGPVVPVTPGAQTPRGQIDLIPPRRTAAKKAVVLRPRFTLVARRGKVYLRATGVVSRSQAGRKVAIQRLRGTRIVTISRAKVQKNGRFKTTVRVSRAGALNVRAMIGSTARTKAATSTMSAVRLSGGGA